MNTKKHKRILEECISFLRVNGITVTEQLRCVVEFFFSDDHHVSAEDLSRFVRESRIQISEKEIKDALSLLVTYGFAVEKVFGDKTTRYEHLHFGEHHDHFYCLKCGKITEFLSQTIEDAQMEEARKNGFHAFSHKMQIHGLCDTCFGKSVETLIPLAMVDSGARFRVALVGGSSESAEGGSGRRHLMDMGLAPGVTGEVIANHHGRLVVISDGNRVALGRGLSQRVMVSLIE